MINYHLVQQVQAHELKRQNTVSNVLKIASKHAVMLQKHFQDIVPEAEVDARVAMYSEEAEEELLEGKPDYVLDAIDNINTKVALLAACERHNIPVLCAAGAGALCSTSICGRTLHNSFSAPSNMLKVCDSLLKRGRRQLDWMSEEMLPVCARALC
jgi:tRNA A37 threonylcarbamoyladenosine dehydratase